MPGENITAGGEGTLKPPGRFARMAAAGYLANLLAIMPPDAVLSSASTLDPEDRGKVPGRYDSARGVWIGAKGWATRSTTAAEIDEFDSWPDAGIGLRLGTGDHRFQAADHDEDYDPELVAAVRELRFAYLGETKVERGRSNTPRTLALYRTAADSTPLGKHRLEYEKDGRKGAFEWLGKGQQCVLHGRHKTGVNYQYPAGYDPISVTASNVPEIAAERVLAFLTALEELLRSRGYQIVQKERSGVHAEDSPIGDKRLGSRDLEKLARAVRAIKWAELSYHEWITALIAVKQACGGDPNFFLEHVLPLNLDYPGNDPAFVERKWDSITRSSIGADAVYFIARRFGFGEPPERTAAEAEMDDVMERYIFLRAQNQYFDTLTRSLVAPEVLNKTHPIAGDPTDKKKCASYRYNADTGRRRFWENATYWPGQGLEVYRPGADGAPLVNTWSASPRTVNKGLEPSAAEVEPYMDLLRRVLPNPRDQNLLLDKMAHALQRPGKKPNWHVVLQGDFGIGKDTLLYPMMRALGANALSIDAEKMLHSDFNEWVQHEVVLITEVHASHKGVPFEKLKSIGASSASEWISVNVKNKRLFSVPDTIGLWLTTNDPDAIALPPLERRFAILCSPMTAVEAKALADTGYFARLHAWMRSGGVDAVIRMLLHWKFSPGFDPQGWAPMTEAKAEMSLATMSAAQRWIIEQVEAPVGEGPLRADLTTVAEVARQCEALPEALRRGLNDKQIIAALKAAGGRKLDRIRLGGKHASRADLWAVRNAELYGGRTSEELREAYHFQHYEDEDDAGRLVDGVTRGGAGDPRLRWLLQ